ncbi:MAG: hypothetical protein KAG96_01965 [Ichthyobacteriaceae bacterium]|nr:hypothetical protein [Ichthyobacteriaceae bacterium]
MYNLKLIVIVSVVIAFAFFVLTGIYINIFNDAFILPDSRSYIDASNMLYNNFKPHPFRPMGYALILGLPNVFIKLVTVNQYIIFGVFLNLVSWLGSIIVFYKTLMLSFGNKTSFWISIIFALSIGNIAIAFMVLTEPITMFLLVLALYNVIKYSKYKNLSNLIIPSSLINILVLIRPGFFYVSILFSIFLIAFLLYKKIKWNKYLIFFTFSIAIIFLQLFMMHKSYGNYTASYIDKITWYKYLGAESNSNNFNHNYIVERDLRIANLEGKLWKEKSVIATDDLKYQVSTNIINILKEYTLNFAENSVGGSIIIETVQGINIDNNNSIYKTTNSFLHLITKLQNIFYIVIFILSLLILLKKYNKIDFAIYPLLVIVLYVLLTSGISFWQGDRFNIILYPIIIVIFMHLLNTNFALKQMLKK